MNARGLDSNHLFFFVRDPSPGPPKISLFFPSPAPCSLFFPLSKRSLVELWPLKMTPREAQRALSMIHGRDPRPPFSLQRCASSCLSPVLVGKALFIEPGVYRFQVCRGEITSLNMIICLETPWSLCPDGHSEPHSQHVGLRRAGAFVDCRSSSSVANYWRKRGKQITWIP